MLIVDYNEIMGIKSWSIDETGCPHFVENPY
jgi:hypothetical protein